MQVSICCFELTCGHMDILNRAGTVEVTNLKLDCSWFDSLDRPCRTRSGAAWFLFIAFAPWMTANIQSPESTRSVTACDITSAILVG